MTKIFKHAHVSESQQFYGDLLQNYVQWTVVEHLGHLAEKLVSGYHENHPVVAREINNYHPNWLGKAPEVIFNSSLTSDDIRQTIASQYGFKNWSKVAKEGLSYHVPFEEALNALLNGNVEDLQELLKDHPELVQMKSPYGHQAQLIHYVGNNGVEMWRQQVPLNLAEITRVLLEAGADKSATMEVYGGPHTTLQLFETSAHPYSIDNREEIMRLLK